MAEKDHVVPLSRMREVLDGMLDTLEDNVAQIPPESEFKKGYLAALINVQYALEIAMIDMMIAESKIVPTSHPYGD